MDNLQPAECTSCCAELVDSSDYSILSQHSSVNLLDTCRLISRGLVVPVFVSEHVRVPVRIISFQPDHHEFGLLNKWTELSFHHSLDDVSKLQDKNEHDEHKIQNEIPFISASLGINYKPRFYLGAVLICGERGCGKTYLMNKILADYKQFHSEYLNCKQLRGKRPETVKKKFSEMLEVASERQPAILALDDIDSFLEHDSKLDGELGQDVIYKKRLVDTLCDLVKQLERQTKGCIVLIASCRSLEKLEPRLARPRGRQFFNEIIKIETPNLKTRLEILDNLIKEHPEIRSSLTDSDYEEVARKCNSFMPSDLRMIFERALLAACARSSLEFSSEPVTISIADFDDSLQNYVPMSLRAIPLQVKSERTFDNVGGMASMKESLIKTVLMPIKYPKLFRRCPLRPQNSVLLYGPPGCGKTLLAEALINHEGLRSIPVRGPELLSKYIGASEAAVRDLFQKARLARPSVIFFDEFESLVARRGADSTGVTDRVVNQFLTVLDGVESLGHDVFIIAATSRPDMIDPAMLRPGRMDKHIYCPLPKRQDRFEILKVLSRDLELDHLVDLELWASKLEGFTGADIQAFLCSAQLKALHAIIDHRETKDPELGGNKTENNQKPPSGDFSIVISEAHLSSVFDEMRENILAKQSDMINKYPAQFNQLQKHRVAVRATLQ